MKKNIIISMVSAVFGFLLYFIFSYFESLWGFPILVLPMIPGTLMVLVQDEKKSYNFLPKLIVGSFLVSLIFCCLLLIISFFNFNHSVGYSILEMIIPMIPFFIFLFGVVVFGGLIGIVIRGSSLLIKERCKK